MPLKGAACSLLKKTSFGQALYQYTASQAAEKALFSCASYQGTTLVVPLSLFQQSVQPCHRPKIHRALAPGFAAKKFFLNNRL
jgi:hypothetical protein